MNSSVAGVLCVSLFLLAACSGEDGSRAESESEGDIGESELRAAKFVTCTARAGDDDVTIEIDVESRKMRAYGESVRLRSIASAQFDEEPSNVYFEGHSPSTYFQFSYPNSKPRRGAFDVFVGEGDWEPGSRRAPDYLLIRRYRCAW